MALIRGFVGMLAEKHTTRLANRRSDFRDNFFCALISAHVFLELTAASIFYSTRETVVGAH